MPVLTTLQRLFYSQPAAGCWEQRDGHRYRGWCHNNVRSMPALAHERAHVAAQTPVVTSFPTHFAIVPCRWCAPALGRTWRRRRPPSSARKPARPTPRTGRPPASAAVRHMHSKIICPPAARCIRSMRRHAAVAQHIMHIAFIQMVAIRRTPLSCRLDGPHIHAQAGCPLMYAAARSSRTFTAQNCMPLQRSRTTTRCPSCASCIRR